MQNKKTQKPFALPKEQGTKETGETMETVIFTKTVVTALNRLPLRSVAPFLDFIAGEHKLAVRATPIGILAKNAEDWNKARRIFENSVLYN